MLLERERGRIRRRVDGGWWNQELPYLLRAEEAVRRDAPSGRGRGHWTWCTSRARKRCEAWLLRREEEANPPAGLRSSMALEQDEEVLLPSSTKPTLEVGREQQASSTGVRGGDWGRSAS